MNKDQQITIAQDLIDFCGGDLSVQEANKFFRVREYNLTKEEERKVFLTAYSLIVKN